MNKPSVAVLASGGGTTVEAYVRAAVADPTIPQVGLVICNNKKAGVFARLTQLNQEFGLAIQAVLINSVTHPVQTGELIASGSQTQAEEAALLHQLRARNFSAVVLMGYMKKIGSALVEAFGWRTEYTSPYQAMMLNTHPGLLPATKGFYGLNVQKYVLTSGLPEAGQTLHVVAEDYDDGPVIAENKLVVEPGETAEDLFARVQVLEKQSLPGDVAEFIKQRQSYLENRRK